jgi:hypothetical protein
LVAASYTLSRDVEEFPIFSGMKELILKVRTNNAEETLRVEKAMELLGCMAGNLHEEFCNA